MHPSSVLISVEATVKDDMNSYISQYYNGPSSGKSGLTLFSLCSPRTLVTPGKPKPKDRYSLAWLQVAGPAIMSLEIVMAELRVKRHLEL